MSQLRSLLNRLFDVVLRRRRERRLDDEVQSHLDLLTDELVAGGMPLGTPAWRPGKRSAASNR